MSGSRKPWCAMKLLALLSPLIFFLPVAPAAELPVRYQKWLDQEVVYIIADEERREFLKLSFDADREAFIEKFWKIRDADPSTQENEFRKEHYARIEYANERFNDGIPGWKSERGRIWILHGPPDNVHYEYGGGSVATDIEAPTDVLTGDSNPDRRRQYRLTFNKPEAEVWVYRHIEGARNFPSYFEVIFSRTDPTNIFSLSQSLRRFARQNLNYSERSERDYAIMTYLRGHHFGGPFRIIYAGEYRFQDLEHFYESLFHPEKATRVDAVDIQLGLQDIERSTGEILFEKRAQARALKEMVAARVFFEKLPLSLRIGTLHSRSGSTVLPVSLGFSHQDEQGHVLGGKKERLDLLVELLSSSGDIEASVSDSVRVDSPNQNIKFLYQTRVAAHPGKYRLAVYAALREHRAAASTEISVDLPDYERGGFQMSDLLLFEDVIPKSSFHDGRSTAQFLGRTNPVSLKDYVLIPSTDSRFRRGQKLTAFFEIYNVDPSSEGKIHPLKLRCRLLDSAGGVQQLPETMLDYITEARARRTTYGISIPLMSFSTGEYSLEFHVDDPADGRDATKSTTFTIY